MSDSVNLGWGWERERGREGGRGGESYNKLCRYIYVYGLGSTLHDTPPLLHDTYQCTNYRSRPEPESFVHAPKLIWSRLLYLPLMSGNYNGLKQYCNYKVLRLFTMSLSITDILEYIGHRSMWLNIVYGVKSNQLCSDCRSPASHLFQEFGHGRLSDQRWNSLCAGWWTDWSSPIWKWRRSHLQVRFSAH